MMKHILLGFIFVVGMVACESAADPVQPTSDSLLVSGNLPKTVLPIAIEPTAPDVTPTDVPTIDVNAPPPSLAPSTPTLTPYVGVFIGVPTSIGPEGELIVPPTIAPFSVDNTTPQNSNTDVIVIPATTPDGSTVTGVIPPSTTQNCPLEPAPQFANAYATNPSLQGFGCPLDNGIATQIVFQAFENGRMIWRDTRQIFVLANTQSYWRVPDTWNESIPASDPDLIPPNNAAQPVRGFGYAWRNNPAFQNALGWAVGPEIPISSFWQEFERGSLFIGDSGLIYAVPSPETGTYVGGIAQ